jgi:3',5'-cyclic-AMP phosphodiesterase
LVAVEKTEGAQTRFLRDVLGILVVPRQPARKVVRRVQVRQDGLLEALAFRKLWHPRVCRSSLGLALYDYDPVFFIPAHGIRHLEGINGNRVSLISRRPRAAGILQPTPAEGESIMADFIRDNINKDGIDRRGFLQCMAWAGTGVLYSLHGGVLKSLPLMQGATGRKDMANMKGADFSFIQISDSHIGFSKEANPDVTATLQVAVDRINSAAAPPDFLLHTGDISQLSKPSEFDTAQQVLKGAKASRIFYVPGEHDVLTDNGQQYLDRFGKETKGNGWYSFDHKGAHFIGLVNVMDLKAGGLGSLGANQLKWLQDDVRDLKSSTPVIVFAHIPLWTVYPDWGWGTDDSEQALGYLKRFGSVSVLNGHIHQIMQKVEGNVTFHTALSTAFPQPAPGSAPSPGPMKVPADQLRSVLGISHVNYVQGNHSLALVDSTLA